MIKAEAYGHGMAGIARAAERAGASMLGFASLSEALALNAARSLPRLVVGWTPGWLAESAIQNDVTCTLCDLETAGEFARAAQAIGKPARVHVKVDTGMHRLGFMPDEAVEAIAKIASLDGLILEGVFTHFAKADEADPAYTYGQFEKFKRVLERSRSARHSHSDQALRQLADDSALPRDAPRHGAARHHFARPRSE